MSLEENNAMILEWLTRSSAREDVALEFWGELGKPAGVDDALLETIVAIRSAARAQNFSRALELLTQLAESPEEELVDRGILPAQVPDARARLALGELICKVEKAMDPLSVIAYARETVSPLVQKVGSADSRDEYTTLLNAFVSRLILPKDAPFPDLDKQPYTPSKFNLWVEQAIDALRNEAQARDLKMYRTAQCLHIFTATGMYNYSSII